MSSLALAGQIRHGAAAARTADQIIRAAVRFAIRKRLEAGTLLLGAANEDMAEITWTEFLEEAGLTVYEARSLMREAAPLRGRRYVMPEHEIMRGRRGILHLVTS